MRRPRVGATLIWTLPSLVLCLIVAVVQARFRIAVPPRLGDDARAAAIGALRHALEKGEAVRPDSPELERALAGGGPVVVGVWADGALAARVEAHGDRIADAVAGAGALLLRHPGIGPLDEQARERARIKVDVVVARGRLATLNPLLRSMSLHPGLEGLGVRIPGGQDVILLPDDLIARKLLASQRPIRFIEVALGLDFEGAQKALAGFARVPVAQLRKAGGRYYRLRVDSFVERPLDERVDGAPLPLFRGLPPGPEPTAANLRAGALAGGHYLVDHLSPSGRYVYELDLVTGIGTDPDKPRTAYSMPRHAGVTYFLAQLLRITGEPWLREPVERAATYLDKLVDDGRCTGQLPDGRPFACVLDRGATTASLGSAALAVVALAEYKMATGDPRFDDLRERLAAFLLFMQRPDGSFAHLYDSRTKHANQEVQLLYFSGEAALALARSYVVTGDARYLDATERALDSQVAWYDFFAGQFFYGEEHWTCIAAEAIWPHLQHDRYRRFCSGFADFLRHQQPLPGDSPDQPDLAGAYNFTPFVMPTNTPAGSRTEAMISAYLLTVHHGHPEEAIRQQILEAMRYALRQQVREDGAWALPPRLHALGAMPKSPIDRTVRIDYVQHTGSAMIRTAVLLE